MRISYFYPPQTIVKKDTLFCKHTDHTFLHQKCDKTADLIYAGSVSVLQKAMKAKAEFKKPLVCWCWDIPYNWRQWGLSEEGMRNNALRDKQNAQRVAMLRECDLVISASRWTQRILKTRYGIASEQIYFFIDVDLLNSIPQPEKKKTIVQISRFYYNKKFEHTIQAVRDLKDYTAMLIGVGLNSPYGKELKQCVQQYSGNVVFYNSIPRRKVLEHLKRATVLTSPSVFEGWGITPIEAIYCGVPILLSDLEVFKEVWGDHVLYHQRNNVDDMKEKLEQLVSDEALQKRIVEECKPLIAEFTPEKFAKRWEQMIMRV